MQKIGKELTESVQDVRERETDEVSKKYVKTVANLLGTMLYEVMNPIYAHYPDLEPEELRRPGESPEKSRPFKPTHRLRLRDGEPLEVMLYGEKGFAHTHEQWTAFQAGECIPKPFWILIGQRWWRSNEDVIGIGR